MRGGGGGQKKKKKKKKKMDYYHCERATATMIIISSSSGSSIISIIVIIMYMFYLRENMELTFATLWTNSADNKLTILFSFSPEIGLDVSCEWSHLHEMTRPIFWKK